ncbi:bifunctional metallophosphatase/5'-nucleotidase [Paenibacillus puerhi]|uniref:bifunctional metallophosphatase/5'-nucleotidase n=1 Tax=Paenibacillus puerhi TaxID=2692622 RepID=UPI001356F61B|nr:bifunctional UDP-sugar hydrolase/5'-nucleotidase [Paenibacillus puerhi]
MATIKELTILYTNDFHAQDKPVRATWVEGSPMMGGAAYLASYVKKIRASEENVILLDAGDILTGPPISTLTEGEAPVDLFSCIGYDAVAIGNHEFDHGWQKTKQLLYQARFPFLSANIFYKNTNILFAKPYEILEAGDVKVGVIGIHGKKAGYETISLDQITELEFRSQESVLQEYVNLLKPHVDLIVVLAHQGIPAEQGTEDREVVVERDFEEDVHIINQVEGIDVLIAGHCHKSIEQPYVAKKTGTLLISTRGLGTVVGYLNLKIDMDARAIVDYNAHLEPILSEQMEPDPELEARVAYWDDRLKVLIDQKIGYATGNFTRNYFEESTLGNLITDAVRSYTHADAAFQVGGGLRADIVKGDITFGDVMNVIPFNSEIHKIDMRGDNLLYLLEQSAAMTSGVLQQSGVTLVIDPSRDIGERVIEATINGSRLEKDRYYCVAVNAFMLAGGDGFTGFMKGENIRNTYVIERDIVVDYIKKQEQIEPQLSNRLIIQEMAVHAD